MMNNPLKNLQTENLQIECYEDDFDFEYDYEYDDATEM
jgi:hypothetical protein